MEEFINEKVLEMYKQINGDKLYERLRNGIDKKDTYFEELLEAFIDEHEDDLVRNITEKAQKIILNGDKN